MNSNEVRSRFLKFFEAREHKILPSSSLVPENDPSVLFTTAGMQQFKNYYTTPEQALKDFGGKNVVTVQKWQFQFWWLWQGRGHKICS
jgi:alanyl-tRNA synthetase